MLPFLCLSQESPETLASQANQAYNENKYNEAVASFRKVIEAGYASEGVYFNLANACYKQNNFAEAILNYEKALRIDPTDENTLYNLRVARTKIPDKIDAVPPPFYLDAFNTARNALSMNAWAVLIIVSLTLLLVCVALFLIAPSRRMRKASFWAGSAFVLVLCISALLAGTRYYMVKQKREAIIFNPTVPVKSSPDEKSNDIFVIHEGTKVLIKDKIGEWYEIRIDNGNTGWVPCSVMQEI
jgi:tetratricopeptide (TPR) repeat protein